MSMQRYSDFRLRGFGDVAVHGPVGAPDAAGNQTYDDGSGNQSILDVNGVVIKFMPRLGSSVAWLQTPVYIAFGVSLLLGALGMKYLHKKGRK